MNVIKKFITVLIAVSLLASCLMPAVMAKGEVLACEKELELLNSLSLLPETFADDFKPDKGMSRAEFASLCTSVFNLKEFDGTADMTNVFSDVLSSSRYFADIMEVYSYGLMTGDGNGNFKPDDKITYGAAVKVIMSALGYDRMAQAFGGYPYGYIRLAGDNDILNGVIENSDNDYIIGANIIIMMYNALNANVLQIKSIEGDNVVMDKNSGSTLLSVYHGITGYRSILQGVYGAQLITVSPLEKNEVMFDGVIYKIPDGQSYSEYFGREVDFYYHNSSKKVVAVADRPDFNSSIKLKINDIEAFNDTALTYYDEADSKEYILKVSPSATVVYNGRPCADFTEADFITGDGSVTLIDNTDDNKYDVIVLSKTVNYVVKSASGANSAVYDMYGNGTFTAKDLDNVVFVDEFGNEMLFDELFEYDVLSVAQSKDKAITTITYSNTEAEGTLESIDAAGGYMIINDTEYDIASNFMTEAAKLSLGISGLFILDINGSVAAFKSYDNSYKYGYLLGITPPTGLQTEISVKLITAAGEIVTYPVYKKVLLDGISIDIASLYASLSDGERAVQQPIRYYTVSGNLRSVDTADSGNGDIVDDCMSYLYKGYDDSNVKSTTLEYNSKQMIFGAKVAVNTSTPVFVASASYSSNDEDFAVKTRSMFSNETSYAVNAFVDKEGEQVADIIVYYGTAKRVGSSNDFVLIDKVTRALDENGEHCYKISGLRGGAYVEYLVLEDSLVDDLKSIKTGNTGNVHKLECGDIIEAGVNSISKKITSIYLYYEKSSGFAKGSVGIGANLDSNNRVLKANLYSKDGSNLWLTQNALTEAGVELDIDDIESINGGLYKVYRYSIENGEPTVELALISDTVDYKSAGTDFSTVVTLTDSGNPGVLVIYD